MMKKNLFPLAGLLWLLLFTQVTQAQNGYFFPGETTFDPRIPTPAEFLGYDIGSHYTRHDQLVAYFHELARLSDKVTVQEIGKTYENRPLIVATVSSPENLRTIGDIQAKRTTLPGAGQLAATDPVVVFLQYSVHGAETSSGEAALLTLYYYAASTSPEVEQQLRETILLIDPAQNPDGRDRSANWHNAYKSFPAVADPLDKEHQEQFPGGRTNHYFTDLNRDWLSISQIETKPKIEFFHQWYPNIHIDFHEMGSNGTYYFEPTPKSSESPIIPASTYEFNTVLAKYHAEALDNLGSFYFTKEVFDNFSPIYGSTYPDFHGGVGITFEQASSRGLLQDTDNGPLEFRFTIRNHVATGIATVKAAVAEKSGLFQLQRDFFANSLREASAFATKGYVFGDEKDRSLTRKFLDLLTAHRVEVYELENDQTVAGKTFKKGSSYVVPAAQPQYKILHSIFEETPDIKDSVFYGSTSYSIIHAYGLQYAKVAGALKTGAKVTAAPTVAGEVAGGKSTYAYLLPWTEYDAGKVLYALLDQGIRVKAAFKPFSTVTAEGKVDFGYGSLVIPVAGQEVDPDALFGLIQAAARESSLKFYSVRTGFSLEGIDLGSNNVRTVKKPSVALLMGQGVSSAESGQVWYLMNEQLHLPVVKLDPLSLPRASLSRYTTIILPGGSYTGWSKETVAKLKNWVNEGGTLIAFKSASEWAIANNLINEQVLKDSADTASGQTRIDYVLQTEANAPDRISGNIFRADIDITNPIGFGLHSRSLFVNIDGNTILLPSKNKFATVAQFDKDPHVNGYISAKTLDKFRGKAYILANSSGAGTVILFSDDPTYRKYWLGTDRLLTNSIFFGNLVSTGSGRF